MNVILSGLLTWARNVRGAVELAMGFIIGAMKKIADNYLAQLLGAPRCPFLRKVGKGKYLCGIHKTKPRICQEFPELNESEVTKNEEECIDWKCKGYMKWKKAVSKRKRVEE